MENKSNLKILIISFFFPPYNKVGGRRWAKHFKYLIKAKVPTYVIAGNFPGTSPWDKDIETLENSIFRIDHKVKKTHYYQRTLPKNFLEKIKWKLSYYKWDSAKEDLVGNYNDVSLNNESKYLNKAIEIIEAKEINTVILSVGPFSYSSILIQLKQQFPSVKFVLDYRDYWEDSTKELTPPQIRFEKELQNKVVDSVDLILSPNHEMQKYYANFFGSKSYCLPHCYDESDIESIKQSENTGYKTKINLIYGGAFYANIVENIYLVKHFINKLSLNKKVQADFYVSIKGYENELTHPSIKRMDFIDSNEYLERVNKSDYAILILPPNRVNAMSSKFYELIALRKPIIYFGGIGEVSEFLVKNKLGFHITSLNIFEQAQLVLDNLESKQIPDHNYNVTNFTFQKQTNLLVEELKQL